MNTIIQRFVRDNLTLDQSWKLIEWCAERGGDEFSLRFMCLNGESPILHEQLSSALALFHRGTHKRKRITTMAGEEARRPTDTFSLCNDSVAGLRRHLSGGLFTSPSYIAEGWFENFTIY